MRVLYVVYWGALEPLGRSLVVPAVLRLAKNGIELALITFEKPADLRDREAVSQLRAAFEGAGIHWRPLRYHRTPKWPATAYDSLLAVLVALVLRARGRFDIVHARTFVAGPVGFLIARLLGARFAYHNEGFYPDEQVDAGVWKPGSAAYRLALVVETGLYRLADGVIALSAKSIPDIVTRGRRRDGISVSPSAIDLDRFGSAPLPAAWTGAEPLRLCYLGSVGGRYGMEELMRFVSTLATLAPVHLLVLSRSDPRLITSAAEKAGLPPDSYSFRSVSHAEVPALLSHCHAGLHFLPRTRGTAGGSPTKIAEYWACGLPVVISSGMGDVDDVVSSERVGVIVEEGTVEAHAVSAQALVLLLAGEGLGRRCREAAARHYGISAAVSSQSDLYRRLMKPDESPSG